MNVNFNGYDENVLTFEAGTNLKTAGVPVKMTDDGKVTACTSGEVFCGICLSLRGGYATVQLKGYVTMPANQNHSGLQETCCGRGFCSGIINNRQRVSCVKFNSRLGWLYSLRR